uniref:SFVP2550 n=1 Tax=Homo sapiens TaxID=9606 RepID=Q6UWE9_HUMAN|nr:SFVP2550 [Homo sapiens]
MSFVPGLLLCFVLLLCVSPVYLPSRSPSTFPISEPLSFIGMSAWPQCSPIYSQTPGLAYEPSSFPKRRYWVCTLHEIKWECPRSRRTSDAVHANKLGLPLKII